jgi:hypothetical protein
VLRLSHVLRLALLTLLLAGCDVLFQLRHVPDAGAPPDSSLPPWRSPQPLSSLNKPGEQLYARETDASLTADGRQIFFSTDRNGGYDIFKSKRSSVDEPFPAPELVPELSTTTYDEYGFITADGLTFYRTSTVPGDQVQFATRADPDATFGALQREEALSALLGAGNVEISADGLTAIANAPSGTNVQLHVFARAKTTDPWGPPRPLAEIDTPQIDGAGTLDEHGLRLIFHTERDGLPRELYETSRVSKQDRFSFQATGPIVELNQGGGGGDPSMTPDLRMIVFSRAGDLYMSAR